jgi:hypothetical protein
MLYKIYVETMYCKCGVCLPKWEKKCIKGFHVQDKKDNIAGLQLADLVVSPIGRHILGKAEKEDFQIISQKFRKNKLGIYKGYGFVVLPK